MTRTSLSLTSPVVAKTTSGTSPRISGRSSQTSSSLKVCLSTWCCLIIAHSEQSESISLLEPYCSEFLIHAADVEGLQSGIDHELVSKLAEWCTIPVTYAGGGRSLEDLELVKKLSKGKVDLTIGSALDIFGGSLKFEECVRWNEEQEKESTA